MYMVQYNDQRLTGLHETAHINDLVMVFLIEVLQFVFQLLLLKKDGKDG